MTLVTQLVETEIEQLHHLSREAFGCLESLREEHDLGDEVFVGFGHCHLSEQLFEIIGEVGTTRVIRVHGDEDTHSLVEGERPVKHVECLAAFFESRLDLENLLRYCREHTLLESVELVEATVRADLTQTDENTSHRLPVESLITIEDESEAAKHGSQSLYRLGLSGTSGPERRPSHSPVKGLGERQVAPVIERSLHQLFANTQVLKSVVELTDTHLNIEFLKDVLLFRSVIESHIIQPRKVRGFLCILLDQEVDDLSLMDAFGNQLLVLLSDFLSHISQNAFGQDFECFVGHRLIIFELFDRVSALFSHAEGFFGAPAPVDLHGEAANLGGLFDDPGVEFFLLFDFVEDNEGFEGVVEDGGERELHHFLDLCEPFVDGGVFTDDYFFRELHDFSFSRVHSQNFITLFIMLHGGDSSEHFREMPHNLLDFATVSDNLEEVIVSDEVETSECLSLLLKVVTEGLFDGVEVLGPLVEVFLEVGNLADLEDLRVAVDLLHQGDEFVVDVFEAVELVREHGLDISGAEKDSFKVDVLHLNLLPTVEDQHHLRQLLIPRLNLLLKVLEKLTHPHTSQHLDIIIQCHSQIVPSTNQLALRLIFRQIEHHLTPEFLGL